MGMRWTMYVQAHIKKQPVYQAGTPIENGLVSLAIIQPIVTKIPTIRNQAS